MSGKHTFYKSLDELKQDVVNKALVISSITGILIIPVSLTSNTFGGWNYSRVSDIIILSCLIIIAIFRHKFSLIFKAYLVLLGLLLVVFIDLSLLGVASANKVLLALLPLLSIVHLKYRGTTYLMGFAYSLYILFAYLFLSGVISSVNPNNQDLSAWLINGFMLFLSSIIVFLVVSKSNKTYQFLVSGLIKANRKLKKNEFGLKTEQDSLENQVETRTQAVLKPNKELEQQKEELQQTVDRLNETTDRLIQAEKLASIGLLASGIAHEINNPLNYIRGGVVLLEDILKERSQYDDDIHQTIDSMNDGINRATRIVKSLNQYSHSAGELTDECNLNEIIKNCMNLLRNKLPEGIKVNLKFDQMVSRVRGNNGKLHQTFINIIDNSLHSLNGHGEIDISIANQNKLVIVSIIDTGSGIDEKNISKIMDPFFTTKDVGEGSGLGLYIVSSIVKQHGGQIAFQSTLEKGTTCTISLPKD
jgi:signal transduction histidine kinase